MWLFPKLLTFLFVMGANSENYEGYKLYQITPSTNDQAEFLSKFENEPDFDFWLEVRKPGLPSQVMVAPQFQEFFEFSLKNFSQDGLDYQILVENIEKKIQSEEVDLSRLQRVRPGDVTFESYMFHHEMNDYLSTMARKYPTIVSLEPFGYSHEGREMKLIRISSGGQNKPTIFIDAGIHAREWIAPPVALYIIHQLVENPQNAALYQNVDWVIIPSLNPDGYEFSQNTNRLWRKTRTVNPDSSCLGTDPNRNFDFWWMLTGASDNPCAETYAGPTAFSEPETGHLRDWMLVNGQDVKLYLSFHSFGNMLLYPWGYTNEYPEDAQELQALGEDVARAISSVRGTEYVIGSSTNVLYAAAGGSDDWVKGVAGVQLSYTIELPAGSGWNGFSPPARDILGIVDETWQGIRVFQSYIENKFVNTTQN